MKFYLLASVLDDLSHAGFFSKLIFASFACAGAARISGWLALYLLIVILLA